jgi:two-component system, OmpR family, sensor kinase
MRGIRDVRTRLFLIVVAALAVALISATIAFNLLLAHGAARDADSLLRQRVNSERSQIQVVDGHVQIAETLDDALADSSVWVFDGTQVVERPRSRPATLAVARQLATEKMQFRSVQGTDERLYGVPVVSHGKRVGTIVAGVSLRPYEQTRRFALIASLLFATTLLIVVGAAVAWLLRSALLPVARMTQLAEEWSEQDLDRRFAHGEPHDELSRLAYTLDRLLDRIAASLRHERLFSAELSHELRTPLSKIVAEAELALRRPRASEEYRRVIADIKRNAENITRIVETLLIAAQQKAGPGGVSDAADVARAAADACEPLVFERGLTLDVETPERPLQVGVDGDLAERIIVPVLDNACRYGRSRVRLSLARSDGSVLFTIDDDGPGVTDDEHEEIFEPAHRGSAGRAAGSGAGLGLALARRLAQSVTGDVEATANGTSGARFVVRLPAV